MSSRRDRHLRRPSSSHSHGIAMTQISTFTTLATLACLTGVLSSQDRHACSDQPPHSAKALDEAHLPDLIGRYHLTMVNRVPGWLPRGPRQGSLELWPNSPARRHGFTGLGRVRGSRPLAGRVELPARGAMPAVRLDSVGSEPQVEVVGTVLYFGSPDPMDAAGDRLQILYVSSAGFWELWEFEPGIAMLIDSATGRREPEPRGYFCAVRAS